MQRPFFPGMNTSFHLGQMLYPSSVSRPGSRLKVGLLQLPFLKSDVNCEIYILAMKWSRVMVPHLLCCACLCMWLCSTCTRRSYAIILCFIPLITSLELDWQPAVPGYPPAFVLYPQHCSRLLARVATRLLEIWTQCTASPLTHWAITTLTR